MTEWETPDHTHLHGLDGLGGEVYARWVRVAVIVVVVGYSLVTLSDVLVLRTQDRSFALLTHGILLLSALASLHLVSRGKAGPAAAVTLTAVWIELHSSLPLSGLSSPSLIVMPVLVCAAGMLGGGRAGFAVAALTSITVPTVTVLGMLLRGEHFAFSPSATYVWVIATAAMFAGASLVQLGLGSFGRVLVGAQAGERRMANLQRHAPDGLVATDGEGRIVSVNPRAEAIMGSGSVPLVGRSLAEAVERVCEDERAWKGWLKDLLQSDTATRILRMRGRGNDLVSVEAQSTPLPWADGSTGLLITLRDITEQERAAANERALRAQLEHSQRLEAVGRLAGGIAHEFNNLLTVVGGASELLLADAEGTQAELASEILAAKVRGTTLTRQLLAFARKDLVQPRRLSLTELVREMEPLLSRFVPDGVSLEVELTSETAAVVADQAQMEQVLVNLVVNAKDAIEAPGRITVGVSGAGERRSFLDRTWTVPADTVELWVEDSGSGMDEATRTRLFEPFFTTKPRGIGTGLGLATVHGIISQAGGTIEAITEFGKGTVFLVRWPVSTGA